VASLSSVQVPRDAIPLLKRLMELDGSGADALIRALSSGDAHEKASLENAMRAVLGDDWTHADVKSLLENLISMSVLARATDLTRRS
jgi:hypothetical protein